MKKIIIICALTGELLAGAKVGENYSDLNGEVYANVSDTVQLISYQEATVKSDTVRMDRI